MITVNFGKILIAVISLVALIVSKDPGLQGSALIALALCAQSEPVKG